MKNKAVNIAVWSIFSLLLVVLLGFAEKHARDVVMTNLAVNIDNSSGNFFIAKSEIEEAVQEQGYTTGEVLLNQIDVTALEHYFDRHAAVKKSQVYTTIDGQLRVDIIQRAPILRVFTGSGESYYIDANGHLMPLSKTYTSRVLVANGAIHAPYHLNYEKPLTEAVNENTPQSRKQLKALFEAAKSIHGNAFWKAQFAQIYVNNNQEVELIPKVGNHQIVVGNLSDLDLKLNKLKVFYDEGLSKTGWNEYSVINLKFKNQVVCTKK